MYKINTYLLKTSIRYVLINQLLILFLIIFINLIELSRIIEKENQSLLNYIYLIFLKIPSIVNETSPFVIIISTTFLFRYLIKNNDGVKKHHTADFDCDGKKDYSVEAKDGTKYVYFSSEGQSNPLDIKTWYVFPKNKEIIRPGYE